jgi:hypothetical protein
MPNSQTKTSSRPINQTSAHNSARNSAYCAANLSKVAFQCPSHYLQRGAMYRDYVGPGRILGNGEKYFKAYLDSTKMLTTISTTLLHHNRKNGF